MHGAIVTFDAMSCQKDIAKKIVEKGCDYFIALKGNQETLFEDVKLHFEQPTANAQKVMQTLETLDKGHGRTEVQRCCLSFDVEWLKTRHSEWHNLNCIVAIESELHIVASVSNETRYFIGSKTAISAQKNLTAILQHWGIENQLHWVLDMSFGENQSRIRQHNAPPMWRLFDMPLSI